MSKTFALLSKRTSACLIRKWSTAAVASSQASNNKNLIDINVNDKTGYAVLSLNRLPANSLNAELMNALTRSFEDMERNKTRGVILTSNSPNIFSAGIDINVLHNADSNQLTELWSAAQDSFLKGYDSSYPIAAAVNGHAIGGGCFFAMICDYRAMVKGYKIGLNEIQVGVALPRILVMLLGKLLPRRHAEVSLTQGILYSPEDALKINIIDEIADDKQNAMVKCENFLNRTTKIPADAWKQTRSSIRKTEVDYMRNNKAKDIEEFVRSVQTAEAQNSIKMYFEGLKNKKA